MNYIVNCNKDPYYNMAFEEYCLRHVDENTFFYIWQNNPSVILGCNQDVYKEVDIDFCNANNIEIVRRATGGGMVYHDLGNVNYSIISKNGTINSIQIIIDALTAIGLKDIHSNGRNDIFHKNKKISGTAMRVDGERCLFHGTLLYDLDLDRIEKVSNPNFGKVKRKAVASNPTVVENVKPLLEPTITNVNDFMAYLNKLLNGNNGQEIMLPRTSIQEIEKLANNKYRCEEWIMGLPSDYDILLNHQTDAGQIMTYIKLKNDVVENIQFKGDFLGKRDVWELEKMLLGVSYRKEIIKEKLNTINISDYFLHASIDEGVAMIIE